MSRRFSSDSYGQHIGWMGPDRYRLKWTVDRYCARSRLRFPTTYRRDTDLTGAMRFAKKWDIPMPEYKS